MDCRVVDREGASKVAFDAQLLEHELDQGFFWLDLLQPSNADLEVLADALDVHELAVEDSTEFGQRPKCEKYDDFGFAVLYGHAPDPDELVEVHCYVAEQFVVTIRRDEAPPLDDVFAYYARTKERPGRAGPVFHRVADGLVDSFFPALSGLDERLDTTEDAILTDATTDRLRDVAELRRRLSQTRRVIATQRDLLGRISAGTIELPGTTPEDARYFRDVYDHLIALDELVAVLRERVAGAVGVYLSASSNQLGRVSKQLTVVATIFLPLAFITGFFGQNFAWMTRHISGLGPFLVLGLGIELLAVGALVLLFKRLSWF
jgi:magnesium transporter